MNNILFTLIIIAFCGMLFINIFFRVKVLKNYKYLVKNKVNFTVTELFNTKKLKTEIIPKHPKHEAQILSFAKNIRNSVFLAMGLIALITIFGAILMFTN